MNNPSFSLYCSKKKMKKKLESIELTIYKVNHNKLQNLIFNKINIKA